jgi:hypothetical protein
MMTQLNSYDISVYLCGSCLIDPFVLLRSKILTGQYLSVLNLISGGADLHVS